MTKFISVDEDISSLSTEEASSANEDILFPSASGYSNGLNYGAVPPRSLDHIVVQFYFDPSQIKRHLQPLKL